ncbi:MAG TPA: maleylpyruvate isomerase family mycothiol-dependent enzyme [Mycobacterium sp.]|nr:maleylpyruvate isomerase family mycothiol-dependent enzyme [Mycobacterium sp.]
MLLSPRYSGPPILTIDGDPSDVLGPLVGQRRRLASTLATLTDQQWHAQSRCEAWTVRDVVAHLAAINPLFVKSAIAGLEGNPTRLMQYFDPAVTPPQMVDAMSALSPSEVLDLFVTSNDDLFSVVQNLDDAGWSTLAESPPGDVSIRLLMSHALWDGWVHERDILLPLGMEPTVVAEEVTASLRYVAALSPAFAFGAGRAYAGKFGIRATDPDFDRVIDVADSVAVRAVEVAEGVPVLRGSAVELAEALSTRFPLPADAPTEWQRLLLGLEHTWDLATDPESAR